MASSADPRPLLPGEPALADRPSLAHPNPAGGNYGITLRELAQAGKINLRGGSALQGPATTVIVAHCRRPISLFQRATAILSGLVR